MKSLKPLLVLLFYALLNPLNTSAQDVNKVIIDIDLKDVSLAEAFSRIEALTSLRITYKTEDIAQIKGIRYKKNQVSIKRVLTDLLANTSLYFEQAQQYILIKKRIKTTSPNQHATIYGFVSSASSGETLAGATVTITGSKTFITTTNSYGFYSLSVPEDDYVLSCSYTGFTDFDQKINMADDLRHNIELAVKVDNHLQTVVVSAAGKKNAVRRTATGFHRLDINEIKKIAMAGGEPDVLKSLQFLPGIQTSNEGTTNLSIRGGSYDQNLVLLDEAPVYNPAHTLGMFSTFNTDAIKDVAIYKGVFPAQYGGRLSSVIDVRMKEGNSKEQSVSGGIGLLASRLTWEGPLKKDRSSFMISGRYSNIGPLLNVAQKLPLVKFETNDSKVSFYDLNVKFNPVLGNKDRLYLSAYTGHDNFFLDQIDASSSMSWGNSTFSARWNHVFNPSFFINTSLIYSHYRFKNTNTDKNDRFMLKGRLQEATLKTDMDWALNTNNVLKLGIGITSQQVSPGSMQPLDTSSLTTPVTLQERNSAQVFAYISHELNLTKNISLSYGARVTGFAALGEALIYHYNADTTLVTDSTFYPKGKTIQSYWSLEPRATLRWMLTPTSSLKFSYGRNYQYQHLLTNSSVGLPTDIWMPSDNWFKPQYSDQFAAGFYMLSQNGTYEGNVEVYYRKSYNIIDFKDNAEVFLNDKIETQVLSGQAKGYGLEMMLKKTKGRAHGWISYTLSKSQRQIDGVNNNAWYYANFDHRHNLSLVFNYALNQRWSLSGNWAYRSGGRTTMPQGSYVFNGTRFFYYSERNGYLLPAYHRLDLSATLSSPYKPGRKWQGEWVFSVYNAYNRKNIFAVYVRQNPRDFTDVKSSMTYLVGALPTVTYNFKF